MATEGVDFIPVTQTKFEPGFRQNREVFVAPQYVKKLFGDPIAIWGRPGWRLMHVPTSKILILHSPLPEYPNDSWLLYGDDTETLHQLIAKIQPRANL